MAINEANVIHFVNEVVRPLSETLRDMAYIIQDYDIVWNTSISAALSAHDDAELLDDGRDNEGISRLTKANIVNFWSQVQTLKTQFAGSGVMDVVTKPTVRRSQINTLP